LVVGQAETGGEKKGKSISKLEKNTEELVKKRTIYGPIKS